MGIPFRDHGRPGIPCRLVVHFRRGKRVLKWLVRGRIVLLAVVAFVAVWTPVTIRTSGTPFTLDELLGRYAIAFFLTYAQRPVRCLSRVLFSLVYRVRLRPLACLAVLWIRAVGPFSVTVVLEDLGLSCGYKTAIGCAETQPVCLAVIIA